LWWAGLQLGGLACFVPLSRLSGSQRALAEPVPALAVGAAVTLLALLVYFLIGRATGSPWKALAWVSAGLVLFWQWGAWHSQSVVVSTLASLAVSAIVLVAAGRFAERQLFRRGLLAVSVTLPLTMLLLVGVEAANAAPPSVTTTPAPSLGAPVRTPDVIFLVMDAYARADVLAEDFSFDNQPFIDELEAAGFVIPESANANYTMTHFSIPSILNMSYLDESVDWIENSDLHALQSMVSGANPVVKTLKSAGYTYVHGAADNWLNDCTREADICLPGPAIDQTAYTLLATTPVGDLLYPGSGDPTTALNRTRVNQLREWRSLSAGFGEGPTFTYLHLGLPHPPLFLDQDCEPRLDPDLSGQFLGSNVMSSELIEQRRQAYVEQVECANSALRAFLTQLNGDELVVVTADHGPDSHGILEANPLSWSHDQVRERMATFTALRLPAGCQTPADPNLQLVNLFRIVFGCIFDTRELTPLDARYRAASYGGSIIPLEDPDAVDQ